MNPWPWLAFGLFILGMLALDLGLFQRRPHVVSLRESLAWFGAWTALALLFNLGVFLFHPRGAAAGMEFFTGYAVEKTLSIDNIFVFIVLFGAFKVPAAYQHKVLFWGILGAIALRVAFILGGLALIARFHWMLYAFGAMLVATGIGMMRKKDESGDPESALPVRLLRRWLPVTSRYHEDRFFAREGGRLAATPLFAALVALESTDIVFAADSIPAIFAITQDPFIVFTSNIFAMLGLRSLYFAVSGSMSAFHLLHYGFASIIAVLGIKMLLSGVYKVPVELSLVLIGFILLISMILSLLRPRRADLKQIFERTERLGLIPFRDLLLIENVVDFGGLRVRDAMRSREEASCLRLDAPWEANWRTLSETRFSRYPLVSGSGRRPLGIVLAKDLLFSGLPEFGRGRRLGELARPFAALKEGTSLEDALSLFQRRYERFGVVFDALGRWIGFLTLEDVLEELVGRMGDEFDRGRAERFIPLAEAISPGRIVLGLKAGSMEAAIRGIVGAIPANELPAPAEAVRRVVLARERAMPTYVGKGLAIPHGRLEPLRRPFLAFARCDEGVPLEGTDERAELFFLLLTPVSMARLQPRLLADIVGLFESEYLADRLRRAASAAEVIEALSAGQEVAVGGRAPLGGSNEVLPRR